MTPATTASNGSGGSPPLPPEDIQRIARFLSKTRAGVVRTAGNEGEEAKRVRESWPKTAKPIPSEKQAAQGFVAETLKRKNLAVVAVPEVADCGRFVLIDCDGPEAFAKFQEFGLPKSLMVKTPGGGRHIYFLPPENMNGIAVFEFTEGGGLLAKSNGYLIAPASRHPNGGRYEFADERAPLVPLPAEAYWKLRQAAGQMKAKAVQATANGQKVKKGSRDVVMTGLIGHFRGIGMNEDAALGSALHTNAVQFDPPLDEPVVHEKVERAYRSWDGADGMDEFTFPDAVAMPQVKPSQRRPALDESGQADHLLRSFKGQALYAEELKTWIVFKNGRWTAQFGTSIVKEAYVRLAKSLYDDYAADIDLDHATDEDKAYAKSAESFSKQRAWRAWRDNVINIAQGRALVPVEALDRDPRLLAVGNGTLDLTTYTLREGRPEDMLTVGSSVNYVPDAPREQWLRFIGDVSCGDESLASYLQRFAGYCLTGDVSEQTFWVWLGPGGANGKDTFGNSLANVLGCDLAKEMAFATIAATKAKRSGSEASSDLMALRGVRLIKTTEPAREQAINEALVKQMTGKSWISARELHAKQVTFRMTGKLAILTNHPPALDVTDQGLRRRIVVVPWNAKFRTGENRKLDMEERLAAEVEGILAWMVEGLKEYDRIGLDPSTCSTVAQATAEYLENRNPLQPVVEAGYIVLDPESRDTPGQALREAIADYWDDHPGVPRLADDELSDALNALGCFRRKTNHGALWSGVRLRGAAQ